ncbi:glycosyltransferase family 4 protein [Aestuariivirga litoralis]|nr:glycosyltransferase family 4 protein [Aestuariivirga litoralis]
MRDLKILALTSYGRLAASSRLRMMQFQQPLADAGIHVDHSPWLSDAQLARHYASGARYGLRDVIVPSLQRLARMWRAGHYDAIWLQKEAFTYLPWPLERLAWAGLPPVVVDYDDATFHYYDMHPNPKVRALLKTKIDRVMRAAATVVAGNDYLAARACTAGAKTIVTIPTVVDAARYVTNAKFSAAPEFRIGWIGSKTTTKYLRALAPVLARAERELGAEIVTIGPGKVEIEGTHPTNIPWTEETEAAELAKLSVGIMPLDDTPWERGKCGYKLIQYMASGLPTVASPVGANTGIVDHGKTGLMASTPDEWFEALRSLKENPKRAASLGMAGRAVVEQKFSIAAVLPQLEATLRAAARTI